MVLKSAQLITLQVCVLYHLSYVLLFVTLTRGGFSLGSQRIGHDLVAKITIIVTKKGEEAAEGKFVAKKAIS